MRTFWTTAAAALAAATLGAGCQLAIDPDGVPPPVPDAAAEEPGLDAGCQPKTCASLHKDCGTLSDGCSGTLSCGICPSTHQCSPGNVCVVSCVPETDADLCARAGATCGTLTLSDRCGRSRSVSCGATCPDGQLCGGGGTPNVCACNSTSCTAVGTHCDAASGRCVTGCTSAAQCTGGKVCELGGCVCPAPLHECAGACVANDPAACGPSCATCKTDPAGTATCDGTSCSLSCKAGTLLCAGACATCPTTGSAFACQGATCLPTACPAGSSLCSAGCCSWHLETVGSSTAAGRLALALDPAGVPHLAFHSAKDGVVRLGKRSAAGSWTVETIEPVATLSQEQRLAVAVGGNGESVVVFLDGKKNLRVGEHKTTGGWTKSTIATSTSGTPASPSLAVDAAGTLHVAWAEDATPFTLFYANRTAAGSTWTSATLSSPDCDAVTTAVALDGDGKPAVLAVELGVGPAGEDDVVLFRKPSGAWTSEKVERGALGTGLGLGFEPAGAPRAGYFNDATDAARLASKGTTWQMTDVEATRTTMDLSFATFQGQPHFAFVSPGGVLRHAYVRAGAWASGDIQAGGAGVAVAVDSGGLPRVAFRDAATGVVRYGWYAADP